MSLRSITAIALLSVGCASLAEEAVPAAYERLHLVGNVGRTRVFASVEIRTGKIMGQYAYGGLPYGNTDWLDLRGTIASDGKTELEEIPSDAGGGYVSGRFSGLLDRAKRRIRGDWTATTFSLPSIGAGTTLPFELVAFGRTVAWGQDPDRLLNVLEFFDKNHEIAKLASASVREHAERLFAATKKTPHGPCCGYEPTFYSPRVVSVVFKGVRETSGQYDGEFHEGLVFGYKGGRPAQLSIGDVMRIDAEWPRHLDALVKKLHRDALNCPFHLNGFAISGTGAVRLFVGCKPGTGDYPEQDLLIPPADLAQLMLPNGPAASVLRAGK